MKYGAMNSPGRDLKEEIERIYYLGADFIDLTLEPPKADPSNLDPDLVRKLIKKYRLGVVGHTAWFLPFQNGFIDVRKATIKILLDCYNFFIECGSRNMNIHLIPIKGSFFNKTDLVNFYSFVLDGVYKKIDKKFNIMVEHISAHQDQFYVLDKLFKKFPQLKFHLDVGHANLEIEKNATDRFLQKYGKRLEHIHISDNTGQDDDHLPIGVGNINWPEIAGLLKKYRYDNTITFEIFSPDMSYWKISRDKFKNYLKQA